MQIIKLEQSINKFSSHLNFDSPPNAEEVQEAEEFTQTHKRAESIGIEEEFVEEIIESDNEHR